MSPIPWTTLLRHGPALVAAASRLLATANDNRVRQQNETFEQRVSDLENASAESARLLQDVAQQLQALAAAQQQTARIARVALAVAVTAFAIGATAVIVMLR